MLRFGVLTAGPFWRQARLRAMGSIAHLQVGGGTAALVEWAVAEVERLEGCWSRFRPGSELSRLNERAGTWVGVTPDLLVAVERAQRLWEHTAGAFDPTILGPLESLGYDRTFQRVAPVAPEPAIVAGPAPGWATVELDLDRAAVRLPPGVGIDLGGIGKGLAADLVAEGLVERGATSALVSLGGDLRAAGTPPEGGWSIPVLDPFDPGRTWRHELLSDDAVVTSTTRLRTWTRGGRTLHHLLDPLSGEPARTGLTAAVVRAPQAWWAEGLAKAAIVLGAEASRALFAGTRARGWLFSDDGTITQVESEVTACSPS